MAVWRVKLPKLRIHAKAERCKLRIRFQGDWSVAVDMMAKTKGIAAGEHITRQILKQADRPDGRRFLHAAFKPKRQLKPITAFIRIAALLFIQLGKAVGNIMPVRDAPLTFPDLHAVQWITAA